MLHKCFLAEKRVSLRNACWTTARTASRTASSSRRSPSPCRAPGEVEKRSAPRRERRWVQAANTTLIKILIYNFNSTTWRTRSASPTRSARSTTASTSSKTTSCASWRRRKTKTSGSNRDAGQYLYLSLLESCNYKSFFFFFSLHKFCIQVYGLVTKWFLFQLWLVFTVYRIFSRITRITKFILIFRKQKSTFFA